MADPEIWGAIHRLAVVMEKLDLEPTNGFVRTDGLIDNLKDKARGIACPGGWDKVEKPMTDDTAPVPTEANTIDSKNSFIRYLEGRIKHKKADIEIIKDDYRAQLKKSADAVKAPKKI
jgi:hypothetical protein